MPQAGRRHREGSGGAFVTRLAVVAVLAALSVWAGVEWGPALNCSLSCALDPQCWGSAVVRGECRLVVLTHPRSASEPPAAPRQLATDASLGPGSH